jgi:hypothetical protein
LRIGYLYAAFSMIALLAVASASAPSAQLSAFMSAYMSNATLSQFSFYNLTVNGSSYIVAAPANRTTYLAIGNNNGKYTLLASANAINPVLTAYFAEYENLSAVSYLNTEMQKYYSQISANLSDCVVETGVTPPLTNTFNNALLGCQSIPNCNRALSGAGGFGVASPFSLGIVNFSIEYGTLNTSLNAYFKLVHGINSSNAGDSLGAIGSEISNISTVVSALSTNPIFPPPSNVDLSKCNAGALPSQEPWYCVSVPYCGYLFFNSTILGSINATQQQLTNMIPSKAKIAIYSSASASAASGFIVQFNSKANAPAYYAFLKTTYPTYNSIVASTLSLLSKSHDSNLSAALVQLNASFKAILSNGVNVSIATEANGFNSVLSSMVSRYNAANQSFAEASSYTSNYTLAAVAAQLNYRHTPPKLAQLASQLQALDLQLGSGANSTQVEAALPDLKVIGTQLGIYVPLTTIGYLIKLADGWFINAALAGSNSPVPAKIAAAPTYAALLSFIIGLVILILVYLFTHRRLASRHKLRHSHKTNMAWIVLFVVIFVLVLLYTYGTYTYAKAANNFLPFAYFTGYLHSSKAAYIVLNGSESYSNAGITSCASSIAAVLTAENKTVKTIQATNYSCVAGGTVSALGVGCIDTALSSGIPVISLSQTGSGIVYKGLYGTILYASGANATGSSCITAQLLSRK